MKTIRILSYLMIACLWAIVQSCSGEWARPPMIEPVAADLDKVNTTISTLKDIYWNDEANYVTEIGRRNGKDIYIMGRVISSDESGNIYKNIVLQDHTGAVTIAVNGTALYKDYRYGQQIVLNLTGQYIGRYNGMMQIGTQGTYNGAPSMTFMPLQEWKALAQQNGLARPERLDTAAVTIAQLVENGNTVQGLREWQSRLIRIDNVKFENPGKTFAGSSATDRYLTDGQGHRICLRTSAYADFAKNLIPTGTGSIVAILSYYGDGWQLLLNDIDGIIGFDPVSPDDPSMPPSDEFTGDGTADDPFTVTDILSGATGTGVWVKGYMVGAVTDKSYDSALLGSDQSTTTNVLIAADPQESSTARCVPVQLPYGDVRQKVNLVDNPGNYQAIVILRGNIETYFNVPGVKAVSEAVVEGASVDPVAPDAPDKGEAPLFTATSAITSGHSYLLVADGVCAKPLTGSYGYLQVADVAVTGGNIFADLPYAFTFTSTDGGYYIQQPDGRYLYIDGSRTSFNVSDEPVNSSVWTVSFNDGQAVITNVAAGKSIQLDDVYGTYGAYSDVKGTYPVLYEKVDNVSE